MPLNQREFSIILGVSPKTAHKIWVECGFPAMHGFVFWGDYEDWRRQKLGISVNPTKSLPCLDMVTTVQSSVEHTVPLPIPKNGLRAASRSLLERLVPTA